MSALRARCRLSVGFGFAALSALITRNVQSTDNRQRPEGEAS
jgi:hypothetical protein